jgi:hypothetical protein
MLVPSDFPDWLRWAYNIAFHTYAWRTFMVTEFRGETFDGQPYFTGEQVLEVYEIENVNRRNDVSHMSVFEVAFLSLCID